jgi:hypothetical protein
MYLLGTTSTVASYRIRPQPVSLDNETENESVSGIAETLLSSKLPLLRTVMGPDEPYD